MMNIDITNFLANHTPMIYSASQAELGDNAGKITWKNSKDLAKEWQPIVGDDVEDFLRNVVQASGGWTPEEIAAWTLQEVQALAIQWIAGDWRDFGAPVTDEEWEEACKDALEGRVSGSIYRHEGRIYWNPC